jgi:Fatty acid desaturase
MPPPGSRWDFMRKQVLTTRNVRGGPFVDWFLDGLNYQIEHHLFPSMPRPNLRHAQGVVRAHCARIGLPYTEESLTSSLRITVRHLQRVGLPMPPAPGPRTSPDCVPAWYVHTSDAFVLAGPFAGEVAARVAYVRLAARLGESMRRDGGPSTAADVDACVAKLRVGYGLRPKPDGRFKAVSADNPDT